MGARREVLIPLVKARQEAVSGGATPCCATHWRAMQKQAQTRQNASAAGLLVLDSGNRLVCANAEAIRVLVYPEDLEKIKSSDNHLTEQIPAIILNGNSATQPPATKNFVSGRRQYLCRVFVLESNSKNAGAPHLAIVIERANHVSFLVSSVAEQFRLTGREKEAVRLLLEGLTSKEIAERMQISPNTVKVFLRLVMVKMGVTTRSGILGKTLQYR